MAKLLISKFFNIRIIGDTDFINATKKALDLIRTSDSEMWSMVSKYVGIITSSEKSGMKAWTNSPVFEVGLATSESDSYWYASSICHDAYHSKLYTKEVQDQLSKYSFGQTEIGSYILNVLCPLGYYQYQLFDPSEEQFPDSRRINLRLLRNINRIQKSAEDCSQEMRDNVEVGNISVNFLSSLIGLYETNKDAELTISADWNPSVPLPESEIVSNVILKPRCLDRVMSVIEDFTPKEEQNIEKTYVGKIINIGAEAEVNNREMVDIKVAVIGENLRTMTVNVSLSYTDNITVVDQAFQTGADVKVTGIKTSTSRSVKLSNASIEIV